jgi:hypothetical protein
MPNLQRIEFSQKSQNTLERIAKSLEDLVRVEKKRDNPTSLQQQMQPVKDGEEQKDEAKHDENTLRKVHGALEAAGIYKHADRIDIVNQLQNAGILFRERSS